jgi:aspartyl-tRNA(Asn)/glutamyl-tRNA(Gln) amidotransferase subunit A
VPAWPLSPFGTLAHVGPMTRTVRDAALLMNVICQPDVRDWYAIHYEPTNYAAELNEGMRGKRIAYSRRLGHVTKIDGEVEALVEAAVRRFEAMGAIVEDADPPGGDPAHIFRDLWWAGAGYLLGDLPGEKKAELEPPLRKMADEGKAMSLKAFMDATLARADYGAKMRAFMDHYDFLVTPATATPAFDTGQLTPLDDDGNAWLAWTPFSYPFNLTQKPAASINCGFTAEGLPVGMQIVGRMLDDAGVLRAAAAYEAADPHFDKRPDWLS